MSSTTTKLSDLLADVHAGIMEHQTAAYNHGLASRTLDVHSNMPFVCPPLTTQLVYPPLNTQSPPVRRRRNSSPSPSR